MTRLTKHEVARRQLGAALALWLDDADPVSVHVLACSGGEIADSLCTAAGGKSFLYYIDQAHSGRFEPKDLGRLRTDYWNAFKHNTRMDGVTRNDDVALSQFSDELNPHFLFFGWFAYGQVGLPVPIEAQVFSCWFLDRGFSTGFPDTRSADDRTQMKRKFQEQINAVRSIPTITLDPMTDQRPLMLRSF